MMCVVSDRIIDTVPQSDRCSLHHAKT